MNATRNTRAPVRAYGCPARPTTKINPMNTSPGSRPGDSNTTIIVTVVIASVVVTLGIIGGAVALSAAGSSPADIVGVIGPIGTAAALMVAALGQLVSLRRQQDQQSEKLDQVVHQTNGGLKQAVADAVRVALDEQLRDREGRL